MDFPPLEQESVGEVREQDRGRLTVIRTDSFRNSGHEVGLVNGPDCSSGPISKDQKAPQIQISGGAVLGRALGINDCDAKQTI
jgi:hypothetical protein